MQRGSISKLAFPTPFKSPTLLLGLRLLLFFLGLSVARAGWCATYPLPTDGSNIVGQLRVVIADSRNTLLDIARYYELGHEEIINANPDVSAWLPGEGTRIVVPTLFILPPKPWQGLVVNIPQRRLYYFPQPKAGVPATVVTYPIGIARPGWPTPLGQTTITSKYKNPSWTVPESVLAEHRNEDDPDFPDYVPPGPDNPLGTVAFRTGFKEILLHGTNRPWGVGMRISHGCIRLYPENAEALFRQVPVGTPLRFINQPVSVGQKDGMLYLDVATPIEDYQDDRGSLFQQAVNALAPYSGLPNAPKWDIKRVELAAEFAQFLPVPVNLGAPDLRQTLAAIRAERYDYEPYDVDANTSAAPAPPRPSNTCDRIEEDEEEDDDAPQLRIEAATPLVNQ